MRRYGIAASLLAAVLVSCTTGGDDTITAPTVVPSVVAATETFLASPDPAAPDYDALSAALDDLYARAVDSHVASSSAHLSFLKAIEAQPSTAQHMLDVIRASQESLDAGSSSATQSAAQPVSAETVILFINGVLTTPHDAENHEHKITTLLRASYPSVAARSYITHFYNPSGLDTASTACDFVGLPTALLSDPTRPSFSPFYLAHVAAARAARTACTVAFGARDFIESIEQYRDQWLGDVPEPAEVAQLAGLVAMYVQDGGTVVLVPHSQGNFFAQQALESLGCDDYGDLRRAVGVVALASPAMYTARDSYGDFRLFTLHGDIILDVPNAPGATIHNPIGDAVASCPTALCRLDQRLATHDLETSYLGPYDSSIAIVGAIANMANSLQNPRRLGPEFLAAARCSAAGLEDLAEIYDGILDLLDSIGGVIPPNMTYAPATGSYTITLLLGAITGTVSSPHNLADGIDAGESATATWTVNAGLTGAVVRGAGTLTVARVSSTTFNVHASGSATDGACRVDFSSLNLTSGPGSTGPVGTLDFTAGTLDGTMTFNGSPNTSVAASFEGVPVEFDIDLSTFEITCH